MPEFDFFVSGDAAVLDLKLEHLGLDSVLRIHNNDNDVTNIKAAKQIFIKLPNPHSSSALINWYGTIVLDGIEAELLVLFESATHIHNGNFKDFKSVLFSDHIINKQTNKEALIDETAHNQAKLTINKLYAQEIYVSSSSFNLLGGGRITGKLGIDVHGDDPRITFEGASAVKDYLNIEKLDITSQVNQLLLNKVLINNSFKHSLIKNLLIQDSIASGDWDLENIQAITGLSLRTAGVNNKIFTDTIEITNLSIFPGKFYISAKSYINFKIEPGGALEGIDLVLDMSGSNNHNKKIIFPAHRFHFEHITIIGADEVLMPLGGACKKLMLQDCVKVVANKLIAYDVMYELSNRAGYLECSGQITNNILIAGEVTVIFGAIIAHNIEANGLCNVNINGTTKLDTLLVNLNLDAANPNNYILPSKTAIRLGGAKAGLVEIDEIFAKTSTLHIMGHTKLGTVLVQTIDRLDTLLWVNLGLGAKLTLDRMYVADNYNLVVLPDGTIKVIRADRMLTGGTVYSSVSAEASATYDRGKYFFVEAGQGISFDGTLKKMDNIGLFTRYGNIFAKGFLEAKDSIALVAHLGSVCVTEATLSSKCITIYSHTGTYAAETLIKAQELVFYTLNGDIQIQASKLAANKIAIVSNGDVGIVKSELSSNSLVIKGSNIGIQNSEIITHDIFVQSIQEFLLVYSKINLLQYQHVLFASNSNNASNSLLIKGGFQLPCEVTLVGVFSTNKNNPLPKLQWQHIDFDSDVALEKGKAYIDANRGFIVGSTISSQDSVIIRTKHSLEVVPLLLYNELMNSGGFNDRAIKEVASKINAGVIDIDAGKAATFVGALFKASSGSIRADVTHLLASPEEIAAQQGRVKELVGFVGNAPLYSEKINVGKYFEFTQSTSISQRVGNLGIYDNYLSKDLAFTQSSGDILLDRSLTKYDKLYLNAEKGKILIVSHDLQNIYTGSGGGEQGRSAAYEARTIIGGNEVHLIADEVISHAGKFEVKGVLKIVTKEGVHLLPIQVHQRLMYHLGSKTTVDEYVVRQVISEINAGYLDIKAGGALEAVSALLKVTNIKLDVKELKLRAEYDIFERHVHFVGSEKWYGGRQEWTDYTSNSLVQPTFIQAGNLTANVNGATTIEAAQILVTDASSVISTGNIHFLHKYDIHVHDHTSSKSYLFNFHKGKLSVSGSKTVKEHFYGEAVVPTLYHSGGNFYGYSDGKIHLLGAKIIGNNIHLVGQQGVKLEAAPYHQEKIVSITQTGMRIGYNVGGGEASVCAEIFKNIDKLTLAKELYEATNIIASGNLTIESASGSLEVVSSQMKFAKAIVKVRGMHFSTHHELHSEEVVTTNMSAGLRAGMQESISSAVNTAGYLLDKSGTHWLDVLDRVLNAYKLGTDAQQIASDVRKLATSSNPQELAQNAKNLDMVRFGVWVASKACETRTSSHQSIALDNQLIGGDVDIQVGGNAVIEGIICRVDNFKLKAKSAKISASHDSSSSSSTTCEMEITIPIYGNIRGGISGGDRSSTTSNVHYHSNNMITVKGQLEMIIEGDAKISGVRFLASQIMVRAQNLVVESLQDAVEERMRGLELNIGTNIAGSFKELGGKAEAGSRDARWSNAIGSIIGTQVASVVVQQTLEIAGGLIANAEVNADGSLTDKGKVHVEAGSIVVRQLHDYDNGKTFGLGATLTKKVNSKGELAFGVGMPVICSFNESSRDIMPVIGSGGIVLTGGSILPPDLSRSTSSHIANTSSEKASLKSSLPVSDIVEFIQERLSSAAKGVAAGSDPESKEVEEDKDKEDYAELPDLIDEDTTNDQQKESNKTSKDKQAKGVKSEQNSQPEAELSYSTIMATVNSSKSQTIELTQGTIDYLNYFFETTKQSETPGLLHQEEQNIKDSTLASDSGFQKVKLWDMNTSIVKNKALDSSFSISSVIDQVLRIPEAHAYGGATVAISQGFLAQNLALGLGYYGASRGAVSLGGMILSSVSMPVALSATAAATGVTALHQAAKFESQHPWLGEDFNEIMLNPSVSQATKDAMWEQMRNDPLLGGKQSSRMDIDPNAGKPSVESFPIAPQRKSILFTPDDRSTIAQWNQLPGFSPIPVELARGHIESFPDHSNIARAGMILTLDKGDIREIIGKRIDVGELDVGSGIDKEQYIERAVNDLYKKIEPYQREGELGGNWDKKIIGFGQPTGTIGHAEASEQMSIELAKKSDVKAVFINQGINKVAQLIGKTNFRPDVAWITEDGKIHVLEVQSKSDEKVDLNERAKAAINRLKKPLQGTSDVKRVDQIIGNKE